MGCHGKLEEKLKAQQLRKKGLSYKELLQHIEVSKGTLSLWCRDIPLTKQQKERLMQNKVFGQHKGSIVAAENKRRERILRSRKIFKDAKKQFGRRTKRDRFITGIALYAGEGYKHDKQGGFTNASPELIKFMSKWLREFCKLPTSKLRGAIWLHEGLGEKAAKDFWSKVSGIPLNQFHKTYIAKRKDNSRKIRKNIHQYGVFALKFSDAKKQRRILGWISALVGGKIDRYIDIPR